MATGEIAHSSSRYAVGVTVIQVRTVFVSYDAVSTRTRYHMDRCSRLATGAPGQAPAGWATHGLTSYRIDEPRRSASPTVRRCRR